jgi:hypothetical protein
MGGANLSDRRTEPRSAAYKRVAEIALAHLGREATGESATDGGRWV